MSITTAIRSILAPGARAGMHIATYTDETDEGTSLPVALVDAERTVIADDRDLDEMRAAVRALGWTTETDDRGVVLVAR